MKKIEPQTKYDTDGGYPATDGIPNRRSFFRTALASSAFVGGSLLGCSEAVSGRRSGKTHRATIRLRGHYRYYPCRLRAESLLVQSKSKRFASYLGAPKHQAAIEIALAPVLKAARCTDVQNAQKLAAFHRRLARALAAHYRRKTRRKVTTPIVTLTLQRIRPIPAPGGIRRPPRPVPAPPRP